MPKEPYNLFSDAGSTLPGGTVYEDLVVILKAFIQQSGGRVDINEHLLMYVDRDESVRVDDVWKDGVNHKVFSIETKLPNQNPEGHIPSSVDDPEEDVIKSWEFKVGRGCGTVIAFFVLFAFFYLVFQIIRAVAF
jgi:hypothetical protein